MTARTPIAGVGNIFLGDDGFGAEVARRLATSGLPDWVRVADYGIRGRQGGGSHVPGHTR